MSQRVQCQQISKEFVLAFLATLLFVKNSYCCVFFNNIEFSTCYFALSERIKSAYSIFIFSCSDTRLLNFMVELHLFIVILVLDSCLAVFRIHHVAVKYWKLWPYLLKTYICVYNVICVCTCVCVCVCVSVCVCVCVCLYMCVYE